MELPNVLIYKLLNGDATTHAKKNKELAKSKNPETLPKNTLTGRAQVSEASVACNMLYIEPLAHEQKKRPIRTLLS